jgi:hypothetical protein
LLCSLLLVCRMTVRVNGAIMTGRIEAASHTRTVGEFLSTAAGQMW